MAGMFDRLRKQVISTVWKDAPDEPRVKNIDDKIALGVLLWAVAEADGKFLAEEEETIKNVLVSYKSITPDDLSAVLASVQQAAKERIDMYRFTREVSEDLPYPAKISIIENLFRVACSDKELDNRELETIRDISGLFNVAHQDFISTKVKIKKEFGLKTA